MRRFDPKCQGSFETRRALTHFAPQPYEVVCKNRNNVAIDSPQVALFKRNSSPVKMQAKTPAMLYSETTVPGQSVEKSRTLTLVVKERLCYSAVANPRFSRKALPQFLMKLC